MTFTLDVSDLAESELAANGACPRVIASRPLSGSGQSWIAPVDQQSAGAQRPQ